MRYACVLLLATLMFPATALADPGDRIGFAVYGGLGGSVIRDEDGTETFRGNAFGYSFGGEFRFATHVAVGLGIFDLGTASDTINTVDTEIDVGGLDLFVRLYAPVSEKAELFALVGGVNYYADVEPGGSTGPFGSSGWELGGGVDFLTGRNASLRLEGRFFNGRRDESGGLLTIGFNYRF